MGAADVRKVVEEVVGTAGDSTVLDYLIDCLELEDNDFGIDGEETYEGFGSMLVSAEAREHFTQPRDLSTHVHTCMAVTRNIIE